MPAGYFALSWVKVRFNGTPSCIFSGAANFSFSEKPQAESARGDFFFWSLAVYWTHRPP